jgi:glycopeptide antibiotics resistance protein
MTIASLRLYAHIEYVAIDYDYLKVELLMLNCLLAYWGTWVLSSVFSSSTRIAMMHATAIYMFLVYMFLVLNLTLVDPIYGRSPETLLNWNLADVVESIPNKVNLVPFKTIKLFYNGYRNGVVRAKDAVLNLVGNFAVFMPMAFFLPVISKRFSKAFTFIGTVTLVVGAIEIAQFLTMSGFADIDDLILNVSGALCAYVVLRLPALRARIVAATSMPY